MQFNDNTNSYYNSQQCNYEVYDSYYAPPSITSGNHGSNTTQDYSKAIRRGGKRTHTWLPLPRQSSQD